MLQIMLQIFRNDVGHFLGLDASRNGMEPTLTNRSENGTGLLQAWCSTLQKVVLLYFVPPEPRKRGELRSKVKRKEVVFASTVAMKTLSWFFALLFLSISSVTTEQWQICAKNSPKLQMGNLHRMKIWKQDKFLHNVTLLFLTPTRSCRETCCEIMNINSNNFLKIRNYPNCAATLFEVKKDTSSWHLKKDQMKNLCREYHITSSWIIIPSKRVDSQKNETWPSLGCESLSSSKTLRYRNHDRISVSRQQFLGFELWTEIRNTQPKGQKPFPLKMLCT